MLTKQILSNINKVRNYSGVKRSFTAGRIYFNKPSGSSSSSSTSSTASNVPGLSEACVKIPSQSVGPGAGKDTGYKNPEYFCYDNFSYYEAEVEMLKYRCPQPSTDVPYFQNK